MHAKSGFVVEFAEESEAKTFLSACPGGEHDTPSKLLYPTGTRADMIAAMTKLGGMQLCPLKIERNNFV